MHEFPPRQKMRMLNPVWLALLAAFLFGGSTPFVKLLVGELPPLVLAGLLYLGCGLGLAAIRLLRDRSWKTSGLAADEWRWFGAAIVFGGVLGPILLVFGLTRIEASAASLLLNLEAVFTAVLAWIVFKENADRRIVLGMLLIVAGGAVLAWDALFIAGTKGLAAGMANTALALSLGAALPAWPAASAAMAVGFIGYGLSLVLFVMALRGLGSARTGAYFSTAPFIGAAVSILLLNEPTPAPFWFAASLMGLGVWLHLTEHHAHEHTHEPLEHAHRHVHDAHHQHEHDFEWGGKEPHSHFHRHASITHKHPHYPDIHHRHEH